MKDSQMSETTHKKRAIVLFNLGGPDSPEAVEPFLFNLFNDPAIISLPNPFRFLLAKLISRRRAPIAREIYGHIGGKSPLLELTQEQADALQVALNGEDDNEMGTTAVKKLVETLDQYIPEPERAIDGAFIMPIEDVFSIQGRGTVVTGRVERGIVNVGDAVEIVGVKETTTTTCTGVEMFRKLLDEGRAGENIGALLRGTKREDVERGQVLAKPGSINPHTDFTAEVYVLSKDEGGRHTPFFKGYRPQFYFRTTDVTGACELPEGVEMVMPGDNVQMTVSLIHPIAMDEGLRFAIREGGRTVGAGQVTEIIE